MRTGRRGLLAVALAALTLPAAGCGEVQHLRGAAATGDGSLPPALAQAWAQGVRAQTGASVAIRPLDDAGSLQAMAAGRTALATIVQPLDDRAQAQLRARGNEPVHVPLVLAPLAVGYNVQKWHHREALIPSGMKFDDGTLAVMFRGRIENWVNTRILAHNPSPEVPDELITVCHRSDPAATTAVFSSYMSRHSSWWREGVGGGERVVWRVLGHFHVPMTAVAGEEGMVRCLRREAASIGYLDAADAARAHVAVAALINPAGRFVEPTVAAAQAAGAAIDPPADLRLSLFDAPAPGAYPIVAVRYALVWRDMCRAGVARRTAAAAKAWLTYALGDDGQRVARRLGYAPLPARIRAKAQAAVDRLRCDGASIG